MVCRRPSFAPVNDDGLDDLREDIPLALIQAGVVDETFGRIIDLIDVYASLMQVRALDERDEDIPF